MNGLIRSIDAILSGLKFAFYALIATVLLVVVFGQSGQLLDLMGSTVRWAKTNEADVKMYVSWLGGLILLLGGISRAYWWYSQREPYPRLTVEGRAEWFPCTQGGKYLAYTLSLRNIGKVRSSVTRIDAKLYQVDPRPPQWEFSNDVKHPLIVGWLPMSEKLLRFSGNSVINIEPGECHEEFLEFYIPESQDFEVGQLSLFVGNSTTDNTQGWKTTRNISFEKRIYVEK